MVQILCLDCQQSKITRHTNLTAAHFVAPESRFKHINMDIVGPMLESKRDLGIVLKLSIGFHVGPKRYLCKMLKLRPFVESL